MIRIADSAIDPAALLRDFTAALGPEAGAIVSFTGRVRGADIASTGTVAQLELKGYEPLTTRSVAAIRDEAMARWPLSALVIVHRIGPLLPGEPIVFVATASRHRRAAFEACDFAMDQLKSRAFFWKRQRDAAGMRWIEVRDEDLADLVRWG